MWRQQGLLCFLFYRSKLFFIQGIIYSLIHKVPYWMHLKFLNAKREALLTSIYEDTSSYCWLLTFLSCKLQLSTHTCNPSFNTCKYCVIFVFFSLLFLNIGLFVCIASLLFIVHTIFTLFLILNKNAYTLILILMLYGARDDDISYSCQLHSIYEWQLFGITTPILQNCWKRSE